MKRILIDSKSGGPRARARRPPPTPGLPADAAGWGGYHGVTHVTHVTCYHGGYSCGGVSTGTAVAAGMAGLATGALIGSAVAQANSHVVVPRPRCTGRPPITRRPRSWCRQTATDRQHLHHPASRRAIGEYQRHPVLCAGQHLLQTLLRQQRRLLRSGGQPDLNPPVETARTNTNK